VNLLPRPRVADFGDRVVTDVAIREHIDARLPVQGYELHVGDDHIDVVAADAAGTFYAHATLAQLRRVHDGGVPVGTVRDHPDLPVRGVMLDVSRDKVPTMRTLRDLIDRLASWKVNQVQLYTEHTFAYTGHPEVHANASPLTAAEIVELDEFCRARHVELVPNQNCLGHMNRWLAHERYRHLAIAPDGFVDPYGMSRRAMTIEPTQPGALALVRELLAELLPVFSSRRVHVGLDEAWELPRDRIDDYLTWVATLRALPELDGREMLIWGDMLSGDRELLARLPAGVTVCEWGYDDWYPFDERTALLADAGVPFWVAPGTSSWLSLVGRVTNAVDTCRAAARAALANGATGYLNTDWGDQGHLQQLPISDPGFAYGAAVSWCGDTNADLDLADALSVHAYDDATGELAHALLVLGDLHRVVTPQFPNLSTIVTPLYYPQLRVGQGLTAGLTPDELDVVDARLAEARDAVDRSRSRRADADLLVEELRFSVDLVALIARDARARLVGDGTIGSVPSARRQTFARDIAALRERYRERWRARNRGGGLVDSVAWLDNLHRAYETGEPDPSWAGLPAGPPS
jgi:hypothetical protein